ncbi:MAG TPA: choline-sulfatase [Micromonosporaceae bacterium]
MGTLSSNVVVAKATAGDRDPRGARMSRPNILLIVVDQMAYDVVGALGHPAVRTPHLDELVARGATFSNAYATSPICCPSRASLMTGKLARRYGVYDNGSELPASAPTVAHHLNRAGYTTVLSGKMHFVGPDQLHGFAERLTADVSPAELFLTPDWTLGPVPNEGTSVRRLRYPPVRPWSLQLSYDDEVLHTSLAKLRQLSQEQEPFFLCASFVHPHDPFLVPQEYWDRYDGVDIPPVRAPGRPFAELHPFDQWIQIHHEADRYPLSEHEVAQARRAYYAAVSYVDDVVGRLLAELDRLGLTDDTVVMFTSDHGEMLGEHGMWFKRTYRDGAAKVPLIVAGPGVRGGRHDAPVSLLDVTATVLDLAEVPDKDEHLADLDGVSLRSALTGAGVARTSGVPFEYLAEGTVEPMLGLRTARYKYVYVHGHQPLLFDLVADPMEVTNRADDPALASVRAAMHAELFAGLSIETLRADILRSQRERRVTVAGTPPGRSWKFQVSRDATRLYPRLSP